MATLARLARLSLFGIVVAGVLAAAGMAGPLVLPRPVAIIGHAGDTTYWPENTIPALEAAARSTLDGMEFDVNRSADGTWWLFHDDALDANTTGSGRIQDTPDATLRELRTVGGLGYDKARHGTTIPLATLPDALDALEGYSGTVIVDCKDARPGSQGDLARLLLSRGWITTVIARSPDLADEVRAVDPRFRVITMQRDVPSSTWLVDANLLDPATAVGVDLVGSFGVFSARERWPQDERPLLAFARRWGAEFFIANDVRDALAWRDGLGRVDADRLVVGAEAVHVEVVERR